MQERRALGKGLSSLIPMGGRSDNASKVYFECAIEDIIPNQNQPRKLFDKAMIDELASSIEEKGIIQPLVVRKLGGGKYELIAGERRLRAAQQLRLEKLPVILKDVDENEALELALIENLQRQDLNPVEEALAYKELIGRHQYTQDGLAKRLGKDRSSIANMLRLLKLPESIRGHIISGKLSMGHARALLSIENRDLQEKIADDVIKNGLNVRDIENWVKKFKDGDDEAPSSTSEAVVKIQPSAPSYKHLEEDMKKNLKAKVEIKSSGKKGKIVLHYYSNEELDRLYQILTRN